MIRIDKEAKKLRCESCDLTSSLGGRKKKESPTEPEMVCSMRQKENQKREMSRKSSKENV